MTGDIVDSGNQAYELKQRLNNLDDREIMIETRIITQNLCKKMDEVIEKGNQRDKRMNKMDTKITDLEKHDIKADAVDRTKKDSGALILAVVAILISLVATAANLLGG